MTTTKGRELLGFYRSYEDGCEAEKLGRKTLKALPEYVSSGKFNLTGMNIPILCGEVKPFIRSAYEKHDQENLKYDLSPGSLIESKAQDNTTDRIVPPHKSLPKDFCVYCGDYYACDDHYIPRSREATNRDSSSGCNNTVACCSMCNQLLNDVGLYSITERAGYLMGRYHNKYADVIYMPEWSDNDINELGDSLAKDVRSKQRLQKLLLAKLDNLTRCNCEATVIPINSDF